MRRITALAILRAAIFGAGVFCAARAAWAQGETCAYGDLAFGPYAQFALVDDVLVSPDGGFALARKLADSKVIFANGGGTKPVHESSDQPLVILNTNEIGLANHGEWTALDVRTDARRAAGKDARNAGTVYTRASASHGRALVAHLFSTVMLLKIMPADLGAYRRFRSDILNGSYCGEDIGALKGPQKQRAAELFAFMLFDDLSEGRMDGIANWRAVAKPINALLPSPVFDAALDAYCFRASEAARSDPVLSKIDPNKVWSFVWTMVAELFSANLELIKPGDFGHFTDISAWQRNHRLAVTLLGTQPIAGGQTNTYGFYQQAMTEIDIGRLNGPASLDYDWTQGAKSYRATLALSPRQNMRDAKAARLPNRARHGLIVFDKTLDPEEVASAVRQYSAYYEADGFRLAPPAPTPDVTAYLTRERPPEIDYMVRDGHADGDDDDLIVLYPDGLVVRGEKPGTGETVELVYNVDPKAKTRRLDYAEFSILLDRRGGDARPLVYLDTSCWGVEKAWISLSWFKASKLLQLSSRTPVNMFRASGAGDATHVMLDAIRAGEDFASARRKLRATPDYASGKGDNFIFPDEVLYPQARPLTKIRREIFVREANGALTPYFPDGYF
jgi:hypothetical protein